jgi:hypothetical protein
MNTAHRTSLAFLRSLEPLGINITVSPRVQWRLPCVASSGELAWWVA